jgi:hypothetical protein
MKTSLTTCMLVLSLFFCKDEYFEILAISATIFTITFAKLATKQYLED